MRRSAALCASLVILVGRPSDAAAQDENIDVNAAAAYFAITTTPVGSGTIHGPGIVDAMPQRRMRAQFGYADEEGDVSRRSLLLGLDLPAGVGAFAVEAGISDVTCDLDEIEDALGLDIDCGSLIMLGGRWTGRLLSTPLGAATGSTLQLAIEIAAGGSFGDYLEVSDGSETAKLSTANLAGGVSLPILLSARSGGTTIIPVVAPGFAYGRSSQELEFEGESEDATESGAQFMLAAGLGFRFGASGFGLDAGVRKVFTDDAPVILGIGASIRLR